MIEGIATNGNAHGTAIFTNRFVVIKFTIHTVEFYDVEAETANVAVYKAKKINKPPFAVLCNNVDAYGEGMIALQFETTFIRNYIVKTFSTWFKYKKEM